MILDEKAIAKHSERHQYFLGHSDFMLNRFLFPWNKGPCLSAVSYSILSTVALDSVGGFFQVRQCWHPCPFNLTILKHNKAHLLRVAFPLQHSHFQMHLIHARKASTVGRQDKLLSTKLMAAD